MFFGNKESKSNYKFDTLKVYSLNQSVGDKKKYRTVYEKSELTYVNVALSLFNKRFDEEDWQTELKISVWDISKEHAIPICTETEIVTVSKSENVFQYFYGWGSSELGKYWEKGTYSWEAEIDGEIVGSSKFYVEDVGAVNGEANPYLKAKILNTYEAPITDAPAENRVYLKTFDVNKARYIMGELTFTNRVLEDWNIELFFNIYDDTGMLIGASVTFAHISRSNGLGDELLISAGWGQETPGFWAKDNYTMEVVFFDSVIAVIPFCVDEKEVIRMDDSTALLNGETEHGYLSKSIKSDSKVQAKPLEEILKKEKSTQETKADEKSVKEHLAELDALIGLENIKLKVREYTDYVSFLQYRKKAGIEDEEDILELIEYHLGKEGYSVTGFLSTENVEQFLEEENPSLLLVDRNLPGMEGAEFVAYLREMGYDVPVIFLTAKDDENELEEGFYAGGDDYMSKPFSPKELLLRIKALLQRSGALQKQARVKHRVLTIDLTTKELFVDGTYVALTNREFNLLHTFMKHVDKPLTRDFLRDEVWGIEGESVNDNAVNVAINRLKNKIDPNNEQNYFHPVWGVGYKFN